jgi:hypothetical protein
MKKFFCLLIATFISQVSVQALSAPTPHIISFFMVPCGLNQGCSKKFPQEKIGDIVGSHNDMAQEILKHHITSPLVQGIYVNYLGYLTYSDYNGQVIVPNKETNNELTVVVTSQIYPVLLQKNTVHHFEIPQDIKASFYRYGLKDDEKHQKWHWNISTVQRPKKSSIPVNALIISANPDDIEIMTGTFPAHPGPNFIMPDMYVHSQIHNSFNVLKFLKINRFFEPLVVEKQYKEQSYSQAPLP